MTKYVTEFEFKDGKLRILPAGVKYYSASAHDISKMKWNPINLDSGPGVSIKMRELRGVFVLYVESLENTVNSTVASLKSYIEKGKNETGISNW